MYESLFVLTVQVPQTKTFQQFAKDVIQKSRTEFNTSFTTKDVNIILAGFHDSVIMYSQAVTDVILSGEDPCDGFQVTHRLWNRTFANLLSGNIFINENGDKETDYTLKDFNPDSLEMRSVINYSGRDNKIVWMNLSDIHWPGDRIPSSNVEMCQHGITDMYCNQDVEGKYGLVNYHFVINLHICL